MLFPAAIFAALLVLLILISGAIAATASSLTIPVPDSFVMNVMLHRTAGEYGGAVAIALFAWLGIAIQHPKGKALAWILCLGVAVQGLLGALPAAGYAGGTLGLLHAFLAQVLLAGSAALVVRASASWSGDPQIIQDYGWPSLRSLSFILPLFVAMQVGLGAAFRQRILGLMPHIIGAMLVSLFILMVGAFVLQQCKDHPTLQPAGKTLMVATFVQVFLGISAFTVRSLPTQETTAILIIATAHVATGAFLLSASVVLGMQIRRNVVPKQATTAELPNTQSSAPPPPD
ncbi:MAG: hypothetical protein ABI995_01040 [Acidobacteriota bacterium]